MVYTLEQRAAKGHPKSLAVLAEEPTYIGKDCPMEHGGLRYTKFGQCVECVKIAKAKYRATEKGKAKEKAYSKSYEGQSKELIRYSLYGITQKEYEALLWKQSGKCAICKNKLDLSKKTCVDHCHNSNKVRGILCWSCNVGLGHFKDNPEFLRQAAIYCEEA